MILALGLKGDRTLDSIIEWLSFSGEDVLHIKDVLEIIEVKRLNSEYGITIDDNGKNKFISLRKLKGFIYRKGQIRFKKPCLTQIEQISTDKHCLLNYSYSEKSSLLQTLLLQIKEKSIGSFYAEYGLSKSRQLMEAELAGLNVPDYIITNSKLELDNFRKKKNYVINKPLNRSFLFDFGDFAFCSTTHAPITDEQFELQSDKFATSFFQEYIDKKYEVRSFYLFGSFYSMAIYSQQSQKTRYDFRNYDRKTPNRCVPYKLPKSIENSLVNMAERLKLNTFSADIIVNPSGEYYFLEVNPTGQFGWLSYECNYNLEFEIAKKLNHGFEEVI